MSRLTNSEANESAASVQPGGSAELQGRVLLGSVRKIDGQLRSFEIGPRGNVCGWAHYFELSARGCVQPAVNTGQRCGLDLVHVRMCGARVSRRSEARRVG